MTGVQTCALPISLKAEGVVGLVVPHGNDQPDNAFRLERLRLGLSISRQIVEAHGGRLFAENLTDPDGTIRGARFTLLLPAA